MKNIFATLAFLLIIGAGFSQTANTDTSKTNTTKKSTTLVKRRVTVVPVKKVNELKQNSRETDSNSNGKKEEEENTQPK